MPLFIYKSMKMFEGNVYELAMNFVPKREKIFLKTVSEEKFNFNQ